jgi:hypothetical protein
MRLSRLVLTALLGYGSSFAQVPQSGSELLNAVSPSVIERVLKGLSLQFTDVTKNDLTTFNLKLDSQNVSLVLDKSILHLSITLTSTAQLDQVNTWNAKHRFTKAYIDVSGVLCLESDLDVRNGVTWKGIEAFVSAFLPMARLFSTEFSKPISTVSVTASTEASKTRFGLPYGFALSINPKEWQQTETHGGLMQFRQINGEGYATIIAEAGVVPNGLIGLRSVILSNLKKNVPDVTITVDEKRVVGGHEVLFLGMEGTVNGVQMRYVSYAYTGVISTVNLLAYTSAKAFEKSQPVLRELLNGLEISEPVAESPSAENSEIGTGRLTLPSGQTVLEFDKSKWKLMGSPQVGRYFLAHRSDEAFAQLIWESLAFPLDNLPDMGLKNLKFEDPDPSVTLRKRVKVNGLEMAQMNVDANVRGLALTYHNYYYSGKVGTVQIMTWTKQGDMEKHEKELFDFVKGFHVSE